MPWVFNPFTGKLDQTGSGSGAQADWNATSGPSSILNKPTLAAVATSGSAADLTTGTLADARLSANVSLDNADNAFSIGQTINQGTITAQKAALAATATWNSAGTTFRALTLNVTDTASLAASLLADFQIGSRTQYAFTKARQFWLYNSSPATQDASNYERGFIRWNTNTLEIGTEAGGTGTVRNISFANQISVTGAVIASDSFQLAANGIYIRGNTGFVGGSNQRFGFSSAVTNASAGPDTAFSRTAAGVIEVNNGTAGTFRDLRVRNVIQASGIATTVTPANNGDLVIEQTANTTLTFKMKGSDGTVRSATLTLA